MDDSTAFRKGVSQRTNGSDGKNDFGKGVSQYAPKKQNASTNDDNVLPKGWVQIQLGELVEPSTNRVDPAKAPGSKYIGLEHIESGTGKLNGYGFAKEVRSTKAIFRKGDLLYGKLRPYLNKVYVPDFDGVCSTDILVFPIGEFLSNKYMFLRMLAEDFVRYANLNVSGVQHPRVDFRKLAIFPVPLPPLPEQHRIVAKIEELFSDLDAGIEALKKVKAELKRYRQSVLKAAVEGKLTAPWREANKGKVEPAAVLLERIRAGRDSVRARHAMPQRQAKDLPPIDTSELPKLPEGWEWTRVGTVAETCLGKMLDKVKNKGEYQPYLRNINVRWGGFDLSDLSQMKFEQDEEQRYGLLHGDLVVCEGGEPGRAAVWTGTPGMKIQKALHRVRFVANTVTAEFLQSYLEHAAKNGILEKYFTGTTIKHFTGVRLAEFVLPLPPCQEQLQIVSEVERRLSAADEVGTYCDMSLRQAERLRQSILKRAFEGKLVPQDPSDEPATVLLERIKRERADKDSPKKPMRGC